MIKASLLVVLVSALVLVATSPLDDEPEFLRKLKPQPKTKPTTTTEPTTTPIIIIDPPPPIDCKDLKPCGLICPAHSEWMAGNICSDACGKETMKCPAPTACRCVCTGDYRLSNGKCIKMKCCTKDGRLVG